ncbi:MAG TPA: phosphoribosylamine--glycine ligase, partial [Candidatus Kapabacteria bacterium]|nr:phosphoribosylamine--glycine ligase [Candidatus Kapabacteria bacterium]
MLKILLVSAWGGTVGMGQRLLDEGHDVRIHISDNDSQDVGEGLVPKVENLDRAIERADLIVFDDTGFGEQAEKLRAKGKTVWGGSAYSDKLELDRTFGQEEMREAGLSILACETFSSLPNGIAHLTNHPGRYVFKPHGDGQNDKILTYIGQTDDGSDMLTFMEQVGRKWSKSVKEYELQQFVAGVEIGISGFFNGLDFIEPIAATFEHKPLMNGNIGPATGEMGTTMFWTNKHSKLYQQTIGKLVAKLQGYVGYLDINCIVDKQVIFPLEFTTRFGYPTLYLMLESILGDWGQRMYDIARGKFMTLEVSDPVAMCVVIATPPWPYASREAFEKYAKGTLINVEGASAHKLPQGIWPVEVK